MQCWPKAWLVRHFNFELFHLLFVAFCTCWSQRCCRLGLGSDDGGGSSQKITLYDLDCDDDDDEHLDQIIVVLFRANSGWTAVQVSPSGILLPAGLLRCKNIAKTLLNIAFHISLCIAHLCLRFGWRWAPWTGWPRKTSTSSWGRWSMRAVVQVAISISKQKQRIGRITS